MNNVGEQERGEYSILADLLVDVGKDYGLDLDVDELKIVARTAEALDRHYDVLPNQERQAFRIAVRQALESEIRSLDSMPSELEVLIDELKERFQSEPWWNDFVNDGMKIFQMSEEIRITSDVKRLVDLVLEEGVLAVKLLQYVVGEEGDNGFNEFLDLVCSAGNLIDDCIDLDADIASGERSRDISKLRFYWHSVKAVSKRVLKVCFSYPKKVKLVEYILKSFPAAKQFRRKAALSH